MTPTPTRPAVEQLRRLRWRLTVLFTVMNTVGLIVFAWLVIGLDQSQRDARLDAQLGAVTSSVQRLIHWDSRGVISYTAVSNDPLNDSCPQFIILIDPESLKGTPSDKECVKVDLGNVSSLALQSINSGRVVTGNLSEPGGLQRVRVAPFREPSNERYIGAVVAAADAQADVDAHSRVQLIVLGGCILLVAGAAIAGNAIAGRSIRPAAAALEQQETLLAETAHDLRTPVAALSALAETAAADPAQSSELLERTVRLAGRMGDIIDGLLVRARLAAGVEELTIQPVYLDQLVGGVIEETDPEGASVTLVAAPTKVNADPTLLRRAIGNLVVNALRHGRGPGERAVVTVTVANGRVTVADRGPGIDAAQARQMFERFTSSGGSSGLGLSIVRWVAEAHGGTLSVYNADEGGAIFEFALPVSAT